MGSKTFNENAIRARIAYGGYYPAEDAADLTALLDERAALLARVAKLEAAAECAFQVLEEIVDDIEEPDGDAVTAYQMLFDALDKAPAQLTDPDYADLPY